MATPLLRACVAPVITTGAVTSDASTQVGDLLVFVGFSQGPVLVSIVHAIQSGFVSLHDEGLNDGADDGRLTVAAKIATVAGAQSYTPWAISGATAGQTSIGIYTVQKDTWNPSILTGYPAANHAGVVGTGTTAPNPPQVTPATGFDYIILSLGAWHVTVAEATDAGAPASYTMRGENDTSTAHVTHLAISDRTMVALAAAENPGSFTDNIAAPNGNIAVTIAIPGSTNGAGASAGAATVAGVGVSVIGAAGSSAGAATPAAVGSATASAVGASAGAATGAGVGVATVAAVGASAGAGTAAGAGASSAAGAGVSDGAATVAGAGTSVVAGVGSAAGAGTADAAGSAVIAGVGSADGSASSAAGGAATAGGAGVAAGSALAAGEASSGALGVGSAAGLAIVAGVGSAIVAAVGMSAGTSRALSWSQAAQRQYLAHTFTRPNVATARTRSAA